MIVQKKFHCKNDCNFYNVLLSEKEYRLFTQYDMTDQLKVTKDSDILAEQKKSNTNSYLSAAGSAAGGLAAGGVIGGTVGAFRGLGKNGKGFFNGMKSGSVKGAIAGGAIAGLASLAAGRKERQDNRFYNKRLDYAQTQARRREAKDWTNNMTNRTNYTY